ncbi:MAG: PTS sugar transporter subunit IIB [Streptococcaceae bacterium]|jgi:PTS system ascorbate-specific IIB component|nr:PTS sugar transporter subunit IIB [Streptococcaceae bacterium]
MYKALIACRAGMGSSMILKIKIDQVIKENNFPIETEHGSLDSLIGFTGDLFITMADIAVEYQDKPYYTIGIMSITNKEEMKKKIEAFLEAKK